MTEAVFQELLALVTLPVQPSTPINHASQRTCTVKEKLLLTLNFLAHYPSL
jgi:hypothetical protein